MTTELKNRDLKHLLFNTDEEIELSLIDIRAATWDKTSVTEDMRHLNTNRVIAEINHAIRSSMSPYLAYNGTFAATYGDLEDNTARVLQQYVEMGAIRGYQIDSIESEMNATGQPNTQVSVTVVPNVSLERVNIEINLRP